MHTYIYKLTKQICLNYICLHIAESEGFSPTITPTGSPRHGEKKADGVDGVGHSSSSNNNDDEREEGEVVDSPEDDCHHEPPQAKLQKQVYIVMECVDNDLDVLIRYGIMAKFSLAQKKSIIKTKTLCF